MAVAHYSTESPRRGDKTIAKALAILERRLARPGAALCSPSAVRDYLKLLLAGKEHEVFVCIFLDREKRVLATETLFRGTLRQTLVYPREVVKAALRHNADGIILAHNHPTGVAEPSQADRDLTEQLKSILGSVDVNVFDHFIVAGKNTLSFSERGWL